MRTQVIARIGAAIFDRLTDVGEAMATVLLAFAMLGICADVFGRNLGYPLPWVFELTEYSVVYIAFFGAAKVLRLEQHVTLDLLVTRLPPRSQDLLNAITSIVCALVSLAITVYGVQTTWMYFQGGYRYWSILMLPQWVVFVVVPLGTSLLFVQFLRRGTGYLVSWRAAQGPPVTTVPKPLGATDI